MSGKSRKKIWKILLWVFLGLIALDLLIVGLCFVPAVQTFAVSKVTQKISEKWGTEISIDRIHITPSLKIAAEGVRIADHHNNDMIYVGKVKGRLLSVKTKPVQLKFGTVELSKANIVLRTYKGEETINIAQWAKKFHKEKKKAPFELEGSHVYLTDSRFVLINDNKRVVYDTKGNPDIDYYYLEFKDINWDMKPFKLVGANVSADFQKMAFTQYGGFKMKNGSGQFNICDTSLTFKNFKAVTDRSNLDLDLKFSYPEWKTYGEFLDSVLITANIRPTVLAMGDVACWAPAIKGMEDVFTIQSDRVQGYVNDFSLINLKARWGMFTKLAGDFSFKDITNFWNARINAQIDSAACSLPELVAFTLPGGKGITLPKVAQKLGTVQLNGSFVGTPNTFTTNLNTSSSAGMLQAHLSTLPDNGKMQLKGNVKANGLNLAKLTGKGNLVGTTHADLTVDGSMDGTTWTTADFSSLRAHLDGDISDIRLMGYNIRHSKVEGDYQNRLYNLELTTRDPNIKGDVVAQLDMTEERPSLQGNIKLSQLNAGAIASAMPPIDSATAKGFQKALLTLQQNPNFEVGFDNFVIMMRGTNLNDANGFIAFDNIRVKTATDSVQGERLRFTAINMDNIHKYILSSGIANASLETNYEMKTLKDSLVGMLQHVVPGLVKQTAQSDMASTEESIQDGYVKFHLNTYRTYSVTKFLFPDLFIAPNSMVDVDINAKESRTAISASSPFFALRNKVMVHNISLTGYDSPEKTLALNLSSDSAIVFVNQSRLTFDNVAATADAVHDTINYDIQWHNPFNSATNISNLSGIASLKNADDIVLGLRNSKVFLNNLDWNFNNENEIHIQKDRLVVHDLQFANRGSSIEVNGSYAKNSNDLLTVSLSEVDLELVNPLLPSISIDGDVSAKINIGNRKGKTIVLGKAFAGDFTFNEEPIGQVFISALLDTMGKIGFTGGIFSDSLTIPSQKMLDQSFRGFLQEKHLLARLNGDYKIDQKSFTIKTHFDTLNAGFLSPFLSSFSDHIRGKASGDLSIYINPKKSYFDGVVHVLDADMGITALNTNYIVRNQDILFNEEGIVFDKMLIHDPDKNTAYMSGIIRHNLFKDMKIDLNIHTNRIMALNTPRSVNSVFYGKAYAAGDISIKGDENTLSFLGPNLTTLDGTHITLQVSSVNSASQSSVIYFKPKKTDSDEIAELMEPHSGAALDFNFTFNVTNDADVTLILESIGGTMNAKAEGRFQLLYNDANDELNLYGNLGLNSGDFKIALYNVVNSRFVLVPGGNIHFDGPLENMLVKVSAYKTSKTSLNNILTQESLSGNVNVNSYIHLNGQLMRQIEPTFSFELPNSSNEVRTMFYNAIDTTNKENLTKQFAYFLMTNNFMPNDMFSGETDLGASGLNLFSNMINNILGNMMANQKGSFGITYNQATDKTSAEYGVTAGANLLKDKISLETSIGYYDDRNTSALNNMYGDFIVNYNINPKGTWKLKAYTYIGERDEYHFVDNQINYTAGVALAFKQDFNSPKKRVKKKNHKGTKDTKENRNGQ
ncbi:MAG: translocation/assembly module TamB domain-containing protein [Bacteroidales bacterium]|nr:translocation/assembly module TamB domain-containing protein [Bacteroidales bacterium]